MTFQRGKFKAAAATLCLALTIAGCSNLPAVGPTREDVVNEAAQVGNYAYIELSDPVLDALSRWPMATFYGRFGDHRNGVGQVIGIGDGVQVVVWEAAAGGLFSSPVTSANETGARSAVIPPQIVGNDGSITVPYAGRIRVVGRTPQAVEKIIVKQLTGKAIEPQALVTIASNVSDTVTVTGEVTNGALVPLSTHPYRILDVIAAAGGVKVPVFETTIELSRNGATVQVPMQMVVNNPRENIFVRRGDVVTVIHYVPTITAVGATSQNAVVPFDSPGMNLEEAVAKAGGLLDERSDPNGVFVLRYEPEKLAAQYTSTPPALLTRPFVPVVYHLNMRDPDAMFLAKRFAMHDKDIVYVSNAPANELRKVLVLFNLVASPVYSAATVGSAAAAIAR